MHAGKLRHRIQLQSNAPTTNTKGEQIVSWATYATIWAAVEPLMGTELLNAQQISAEITSRVRIRHRAGVIPQHRIIYKSRTLEIVNVLNPAERNITQHLLCKEVVQEVL